MKGHNFTCNNQNAKKYGVHEIVMETCELMDHPFETECIVKFVSPSGKTIKVNAFYDGGAIWRARLYVNEEGEWNWKSDCPYVSDLDGQCGTFKAESSNLRGMLRKCPDNPRQWITDDSRWFLNISDSPYPLFHPSEKLWKEYIRDLAELGVTSVRCDSLGGDIWDEGWKEGEGGTPEDIKDVATYMHEYNFYPWDKKDQSRLDLERFQTTDERLAWMLDNYPDIYVQMILVGTAAEGLWHPGKKWFAVPEKNRKNLMNHMIARWAAFPQIFWQVTHDIGCSTDFKGNQAFIREVGRHFAENDPWQHLLSVGPCRYADFPFTTQEDLKWVSYIFLEDSEALDAEVIDKYAGYPLHVFLGEDRYEQYQWAINPVHYIYNPQYYYRWLFWSWLLSGGSANYSGRWASLDPYFKTGSIVYREPYWDKMLEYHEELRGLHSIRHIKDFFESRGISLDQFIPEHRLAEDADKKEKNGYIKLMRKGYEEFIIYHPNAFRAGTKALIDENKHASFYINFIINNIYGFLYNPPVSYDVEWYRPSDGESMKAGQIDGMGRIKVVAPWKGTDVVLYLRRNKIEIRSEDIEMKEWI